MCCARSLLDPLFGLERVPLNRGLPSGRFFCLSISQSLWRCSVASVAGTFNIRARICVALAYAHPLDLSIRTGAGRIAGHDRAAPQSLGIFQEKNKREALAGRLGAVGCGTYSNGSHGIRRSRPG